MLRRAKPSDGYRSAQFDRWPAGLPSRHSERHARRRAAIGGSRSRDSKEDDFARSFPATGYGSAEHVDLLRPGPAGLHETKADAVVSNDDKAIEMLSQSAPIVPAGRSLSVCRMLGRTLAEAPEFIALSALSM